MLMTMSVFNKTILSHIFFKVIHFTEKIKVTY